MPFQAQKPVRPDRSLDLAAALFSVLGAEIPHRMELEGEASATSSSR